MVFSDPEAIKSAEGRQLRLWVLCDTSSVNETMKQSTLENLRFHLIGKFVKVVGIFRTTRVQLFNRWIIRFKICGSAFSPFCATGNWAERVNHFLCFVYSLANVDPIDVARNITGLNPETTLGRFFTHWTILLPRALSFKLLLFIGTFFICFYLLNMLAVVVVSKTFTTAETMLNARTLREWISAALGLVIIYNIIVMVVLASLLHIEVAWYFLCK